MSCKKDAHQRLFFALDRCSSKEAVPTSDNTPPPSAARSSLRKQLSNNVLLISGYFSRPMSVLSPTCTPPSAAGSTLSKQLSNTVPQERRTTAAIFRSQCLSHLPPVLLPLQLDHLLANNCQILSRKKAPHQRSFSAPNVRPVSHLYSSLCSSVIS
jgi:hypothetical protein